MKWLAPPVKRRGAADWIDLILKDHGFLRLFWHNRHEIAPSMWRGNQPGPVEVRRIAASGVKTIINLRGPRDDGVWQLEAEACAKAGVTLLDFTARSRAAPDKAMLHDAKAIFEAIEKPALMHCKSGADRAGLMSALYMLVAEKCPAREAAKQLAWKYGHVKQAKTGLLDVFFKAYFPHEDQGMDFYDWVDNVYDPEAMLAEFRSQSWADRLIDSVLRRE